MDNVDIKLTGFKELEDKLKQLTPEMGSTWLRTSNYAGAAFLRDRTKETTAFHDISGDLRKAISVFRRPSTVTDMHHAVGVRGTKQVKYANSRLNRRLRRAGKKYTSYAGQALIGKFLEFGTSRMPPHPFLRPAFLANIDGILDAIKVKLQFYTNEHFRK